MDVILGDIRSFITDEVLNDNDLIGNMGHMQIIRNTKEINDLIFSVPQDIIDKVVLDVENNYFFDEREYSRFNLYKNDRKMLIWDDVADVRSPTRSFGLKYFRFTFPCDDSKKHHKQSCFYDRSLKKLYLTKVINKKMAAKEVIYLHLQKRKMKNDIKDSHSNYLCLPNRFIECKTINQIKKKYKFYFFDFIRCEWSNRKIYFRRLKNRIVKGTSK